MPISSSRLRNHSNETAANVVAFGTGNIIFEIVNSLWVGPVLARHEPRPGPIQTGI